MKKVNIVLGLLGVLVLSSCHRWPSVIVGDSSGYLQYNRGTGILEILWEKHGEVRDTVFTNNQPDPVVLSRDIK